MYEIFKSYFIIQIYTQIPWFQFSHLYKIMVIVKYWNVYSSMYGLHYLFNKK